MRLAPRSNPMRRGLAGSSRHADRLWLYFDQPALRHDPVAVREDRRQTSRRQPEMRSDHALRNRPDVKRWLKVAVLEQLPGRETRPVRHHPPAGNRAPHQERHRRRAMIGAVGPIHPNRPANFQMLTLNTAGYSRVRRLNVAVWGHSASLDVASISGGDCGVRLTESDDPGTGLLALSIPDILDRVGWDRVDFLKCAIEGAELSVFRETGALIANMVQCCSVETHDAIAPGSSRTVKDSFPTADFINTRSGDFEVFIRRNAVTSGGIAAVSVLRPEHGSRPISLTNVRTEEWAYYMFDT